MEDDGDLKHLPYSSHESLQPHRVKKSNAEGYGTAQSEPAQQAKMLSVPALRGREEMPFRKKTSIPTLPTPNFPTKNFN